ncbi:hypothetical protein OBV_p-00600 (plasmid) [Oscillibacter valericigenes Sjm18-20]|nr:hypothetical protein OBV_p-00600 [Oscillibacter valericigenes Sjm18-20]
MAIITSEFETLVDTTRVDDKVTLKGLVETSREMQKHWSDKTVNNEERANFGINDELQFVYQPERGERRAVDITDTAFSQLCTRLGVPAKYVRKCVESGKTSLALANFHAWSDDCRNNMLVREYDGVARAVLSDSYAPYDSYKVLRALNYTVDSKRFVPTQVHLAADRLHVRFVDYNQLPVDNDGSPLYAGFIVDSSDVGRGSLNMKFFLYRSVCRNGMAISSLGGTLFRQSHIGEKMTESKMMVFNRAFMDVDRLCENAVALVKENRGKQLKDYEMEMYLEKARREMRLSEKSMDKLKGLVGNNSVYEPTKWGFINGVTELAQDFTLDTRIDMENWAGELFTKSAA